MTQSATIQKHLSKKSVGDIILSNEWKDIGVNRTSWSKALIRLHSQSKLKRLAKKSHQTRYKVIKPLSDKPAISKRKPVSAKKTATKSAHNRVKIELDLPQDLVDELESMIPKPNVSKICSSALWSHVKDSLRHKLEAVEQKIHRHRSGRNG